jgi:hypothetical protein
VSGDEYVDPDFIAWIKELSLTSWVVICVGGGTQINEVFDRRGFPVKPHGPLGREMDTFEQRQLARDILETNQLALQNRLAEENVHVTVEIPFITVGSVLCPINGDEMVRTVYLGYDVLYVVTTPQRQHTKIVTFQDLPKVRIKTFR